MHAQKDAVTPQTKSFLPEICDRSRTPDQVPHTSAIRLLQRPGYAPYPWIWAAMTVSTLTKPQIPKRLRGFVNVSAVDKLRTPGWLAALPAGVNLVLRSRPTTNSWMGQPPGRHASVTETVTPKRTGTSGRSFRLMSAGTVAPIDRVCCARAGFSAGMGCQCATIDIRIW